MKKYIIIASLLAVVVIGIGVSKGQTKEIAANDRVASAVVLSNATYDFGTIDIFAGNVETDFVLRNTGNEEIQILSAQTSCMCTKGVIDDLTFSMHETSGKMISIPAGGEKILTAIYDPLAHGPNGTGRITRELVLKTNSSETPELKARIDATVVKTQ